jgi:hypothetical protein
MLLSSEISKLVFRHREQSGKGGEKKQALPVNCYHVAHRISLMPSNPNIPLAATG